MGHEGHRNRLREKAFKDVTETHEKLELLLFSALPRVNTNEIAHDLLDTFGDINGVFCASVEHLTKVQGVGRAAAIQIRNVAGIIREYQIGQCDKTKLLSDETELLKYLVALFVGFPYEVTYMLMFSKAKKYLGYKAIGRGSYQYNTVYLGKAVEYARENGAKSVIMAHNHPDLSPYASDADISTAKTMNACFAKNGMSIHEHFVVFGGMCTKVPTGQNGCRSGK